MRPIWPGCAACGRHGWPDNQSCMNLVAWCWRTGEERLLVVVNLSESKSQARVEVPWGDLGGRSWRLTDPVSGARYERNGDEIRDIGLYVDMGGWEFHFFRVEPAA